MNRLPDWLHLEWGAILLPAQPPLAILRRGTLSCIGLFHISRFIMRRQTGAMSVADLLVIVIIADASQNAMAGTRMIRRPIAPSADPTSQEFDRTRRGTFGDLMRSCPLDG